MNLRQLRYPLLLVHGMGFRDNKIINYWGRIPGELEKLGCRIYYGNQDSNGDIKTNAEVIGKSINEIIGETSAEKVNIIAHSKGGLDCRYAVSTLHFADKVASLTTISTPHNGSETADKLMSLPDAVLKSAGAFADFLYRLAGDKAPSSYKAFQELTTAAAKKFNICNPDDERVYYQSYAFVMKNPLSDIFMCLPNMVVNRIEGENDGLLTPESVKWGNFKGIYHGVGNRGISHWDEIDIRRRPLSGKEGNGISDIINIYKDIVNGLCEMGF